MGTQHHGHHPNMSPSSHNSSSASNAHLQATTNAFYQYRAAAAAAATVASASLQQQQQQQQLGGSGGGGGDGASSTEEEKQNQQQLNHAPNRSSHDICTVRGGRMAISSAANEHLENGGKGGREGVMEEKTSSAAQFHAPPPLPPLHPSPHFYQHRHQGSCRYRQCFL
jgi:hypothetical protein